MKQYSTCVKIGVTPEHLASEASPNIGINGKADTRLRVEGDEAGTSACDEGGRQTQAEVVRVVMQVQLGRRVVMQICIYVARLVN